MSIDDLENAARSTTGGSAGRVIESLRRSWPELIAEHGPRVQTMLDDLPTDLWDSDPWLVAAYGSSFRSVRSTGRSAALPYFSAAQSMITDETPAAVRIDIGLHHSAALRGLGRLTDALECATTSAADVDADTTLPLAARISLGARASLQRGLACYHLGDYDAAAVELGLACALAATNLSSADQVECFSGMAMVQYSLGHFDQAGHFVQAARLASAESGLMESRFGAGALVADLLMRVEQGRLDDSESLAAVVASATQDSEWEPLGLYSRATISILSEKYVEGLDLLRLCVQEYATWTPPGAIVTISEGLRATFLLRLGEAESAWDILGALQPTQHHSNCPGRFIAHLRFISGDVRGALDALHDCEALGDVHSSRTLVDVFLIKAAATHQLSDFVISDISFDRAMLLATANGLRTPFRLVPSTVMRAMIARALTRPQPPGVVELFDSVADSAVIVGAVDVGMLSERELDIVMAITRDLSVAEIARSLFISVNTVKTHVKSVYRKLGVNSRADAIKRAKTLGLHWKTTADSPAPPPG